MKIGKLVLGAALTVAASTAFAQGPSPDAHFTEQAGWAGLESGLSLAAADIADKGCPMGFHTLDVVIEADGSGVIKLGCLLNLNIVKTASSTKGNLFRVTGGGIFRSTTVTNFIANYGFDRDGAMMWGKADMVFDGHSPYDEHIIKDFYLVDPKHYDLTKPEWHADVKDEGLELITKLDYPRAKWFQKSYHKRPNGGDGAISVTKYQIAPDSALLCKMTYSAGVDNIGFGWETVGGLLVIMPQVAP